MKEFCMCLSYKDIKILKHSLEKRIERDKTLYESLKKIKESKITEKDKHFIKDYEEHIKCLEHYVDEMKRVGYLGHGRGHRNIFGKKYEYD